MKKLLLILIFLCFICSCDNVTIVETTEKFENFKVTNVDNVLAKGYFYINKSNPIKNLTIPFLSNDYDLNHYIYEKGIDFKINEVIGSNTENIETSFDGIIGIYSYKDYCIQEAHISLNIKEDIEQVIHIEEIDFLIAEEHEVKVKVDFDINVVPNYEFFFNENGSMLLDNTNYNISNCQTIGYDLFYERNESIIFDGNDVDKFLTSKNDSVFLSASKLIEQDNVTFSNLRIGSGVNEDHMFDFDKDYTKELLYSEVIFRQLILTYDIEENDKSMYNYYTIIFKYKFSYEDTERFVVYRTNLMCKSYVEYEIMIDSINIK